MGLFESFVSNSSYSSRGYDAALDCMLESVDADMEVIRAMHNYEMLSIQMESGQYIGEEVLTEAASDIVTRVKNAITKLINAIRERLIAVKNWILKKAKAFKEWAKGLKDKKKDKKADKPAEDAHKKSDDDDMVWEYAGLVKLVNSGNIEGSGSGWSEPFEKIADKFNAYLRGNVDYNMEAFANTVGGEAKKALEPAYGDYLRKQNNIAEMQKELRGKRLQQSQFVMVHKNPEEAITLYEKGAAIVDKELSDLKGLERNLLNMFAVLKNTSDMGHVYGGGTAKAETIEDNIKRGESRGQSSQKMLAFATTVVNRVNSNVQQASNVFLARLNMVRSELDGFSRAIAKCELEYYAM